MQQSQVGKPNASHARFALLSVAGALAALLTGCGASRPAQVQSVATHDLACDHVDVSEVADRRYAAYGCGRGAVYTELCDDSGCRWGRLRHGHEESIAAGAYPPAAEREILPAPAAEPRQVLPAPVPGQREVIAAPAPASGGEQPAPQDQSAPQNQATQQPLQDSALTPGAAPASAPIPLSDGSLSDPYQAEVPLQPIAQQVVYAPPAPLYETRPLPPARSHVWINGYWWWGSANWLWVPGYWCSPYYGYSYVPGGWYWSGGYWNYGVGGWARRGTTVIIHRNFPPRSSSYATVRAFRPHRVASSGYGGVGNRGVAVHRVSPGVQRVPPSVHRVAPASFQPRGSPLYPYSNKSAVRTSPGVSGYGYDAPRRYGAAPSGFSHGGSGSVGRVVAPNTVVSPPASYGGRRMAPSRSFGGDSYRGSSSSGFGGGRAYGGGGGHHSSGRSYGGGGGGGGGRSMGSVRVSPGGGGGRRR